MGKYQRVPPGDYVVIAGEIRVYNRGEHTADWEIVAPACIIIGEVTRPVEKPEAWDKRKPGNVA